VSSLRTVRLVAGREVVLKLQSKVFQISTAITALLVVGIILSPQLLPGESSEYRIGITAEVPAALRELLNESALLLEADHRLVTYPSADEALEAVRSEEADAAITDGSTMVFKDERETQMRALVSDAVIQHSRVQLLEAAGLDAGQVSQLMGPPDVEETVLEPGPEDDGAGIGFAAVAAMFLAIGLYSQWVMSGVLEEKSSRVVEVVLGALTPRQLLAGKVIGIGGLGLLHMVALAVVGAVAASFGGTGVPEAGTSTFVTAGAWFFLGYGFYAVLSAVAAALVSRQDDLQIAFLPVMAIAMASYFFSIATLSDPGGTLARIGSLIPSVAPFAIPARAAQGAITAGEQVVSAGITLLTIGVLAMIGSRIYSGAILRFGPRIRLREAWKRT
jgi:ABC-2 type transport system permease protein